MNALEYQEHIADRMAAASPGSLRRSMYNSEGVDATDEAIRRGLRAWAVKRITPRYSSDLVETTIVFGRSRSDALRRASAPARLGEETASCTTIAEALVSGWDAPIAWPLHAR